METVFVVRSALANDWITAVLTALEETKRNRKAAIVFSEESLRVLRGEAFDWSPLLKDRETMSAIGASAAKWEAPFQSDLDRRQVDVWKLVRQARQKGVGLFGCPFWTELLGTKQLPENIKVLSRDEFADIFRQAARVFYL